MKNHFQNLKAALKKNHFSQKEIAEIEAAYFFAEKMHAGQKRKTGDDYISHPVAVAEILLDLGADAETLIAAILHDTVEDTAATLEIIEKKFGKKIAALVDGVTKIQKLQFPHFSAEDFRAANLRKMFSRARENERAILIKLADRAHNIQTISHFSPEKARRIADETMNIYHPLAKIFGVWVLKRQFEHFCFPILHPKKYKKVVAIQKRDREKNAEKRQKLRQKIQNLFSEKSLSADIFLREKSPFALAEYSSKKNENISRDEIYHFFRFDLFVETVEECYRALGILHRHFSHRPKEFRDFISNPKNNGYQSLHTTVFIDGNAVPFHLQTRDMHRSNEKCAFFLFPEKFPAKNLSETLRFLDDHYYRSQQYLRDLQKDVLEKKILVTTKKGEKIFLPVGSTALDAAFFFSPARAMTTKKILVNHQKVPFDFELSSNDAIDFDFSAKKKVPEKWADFLKTTVARNLFFAEIRQKDRLVKQKRGREKLQKGCDRYGKGDAVALAENKKLLAHFAAKNPDELFLLIGEGIISPYEIFDFLEKSPPFFQKFFQRFFQKKTQKSEISVLVFLHRRQKFFDEFFSMMNAAGVFVEKSDFSAKKSAFRLFLFADKKQKIDRFLLHLLEDPRIRAVKTFLPAAVRLHLFFNFLLTAALWALFLIAIFFPGKFLPPASPHFLLVALVAAHFFEHRLFLFYWPRLREKVWIPFVFFFLNFSAVAAEIFFLFREKISFSFYWPLAILVFSAMTIAVVFFQKSPADQMPKLHFQKWREHRRQKIIGYAIRFAAVILWGIQPLFLKYTPTADLPPFLRLFFIFLGSAATGFLIFLFRGDFKNATKIPKNTLFFLILLADIAFTYLMNKSLMTTSGTNFILFNNFAPVFSLLVAAILWRREIPYLQTRRHFLMIFGLFLLGGMGATLLFYNDFKTQNSLQFFGDIFAILAMVADVILVSSQIRYARFLDASKSIFFTFLTFLFATITFFPVFLFFFFSGFSFSFLPILFSLLAGVLVTVATILNYEAFRRIDGFLAFLMFNISILITFLAEMFFFKNVPMTPMLLVAAGLIVGASIFAEKINTKCEKELLKKQNFN